MILVCSMQQGAVPPCVEMQDTLGPYESHSLCKARVDEMVLTLPEMFKPPYNVKFKCAMEPITKGLGV